jgi:hypothetical protein
LHTVPLLKEVENRGSLAFQQFDGRGADNLQHGPPPRPHTLNRNSTTSPSAIT